MLYSIRKTSLWRKRTTHFLESHLSPAGIDEEALATTTADLATDEVMGLVDQAWSAEKRYLAEELFAELRDARADLTAEEQELVRLHYDDDKELLEIVDPKRKGWSERSLQRKHHEVLGKLRKRIVEQSSAPG